MDIIRLDLDRRESQRVSDWRSRLTRICTTIIIAPPTMLTRSKTGDVIVELGGVAVKDLYSYSNALYAHKPGDVVKVVVLRGGERLELAVTLGRRGEGHGGRVYPRRSAKKPNNTPNPAVTFLMTVDRCQAAH